MIFHDFFPSEIFTPYGSELAVLKNTPWCVRVGGKKTWNHMWTIDAPSYFRKVNHLYTTAGKKTLASKWQKKSDGLAAFWTQLPPLTILSTRESKGCNMEGLIGLGD